MFNAPVRVVLAVLAVVSVLYMHGCGGGSDSDGDARVGTWELDFDAMKAQMPADEPGAQFAMSMLETMKVQLETRPDGTFEARAQMFGDEDSVTGTWQPTDDGFVMITKQRNGESMEDEAVVKLNGRDQLVAQRDGDDDRMIFRRVVASAAE